MNRVGVNVEQLEAKNNRLKAERRSLDMSQVKKKKFNQIGQRKQSYAPAGVQESLIKGDKNTQTLFPDTVLWIFVSKECRLHSLRVSYAMASSP